MTICSPLTSSYRWSSQRIVFGKPLIEQPVVRHKWVMATSRLFVRPWLAWIRIAHMISSTETSQTWLEHISACHATTRLSRIFTFWLIKPIKWITWWVRCLNEQRRHYADGFYSVVCGAIEVPCWVKYHTVSISHSRFAKAQILDLSLCWNKIRLG